MLITPDMLDICWNSTLYATSRVLNAKFQKIAANNDDLNAHFRRTHTFRMPFSLQFGCCDLENMILYRSSVLFDINFHINGIK